MRKILTILVLVAVISGCARPPDDLRPADPPATSLSPDEQAARAAGVLDTPPPLDQKAFEQSHQGPRFSNSNLGDGCDHNYRSGSNACIPVVTRSAPDVGKAADQLVSCAGLRASGYLSAPLVVQGDDDQVLDDNKDGVVCGAGDD